MKITIGYENDGMASIPCCAFTTLPNGRYICAWEQTYEKAKERLIARIQKLTEAITPPNEEIEVGKDG